MMFPFLYICGHIITIDVSYEDKAVIRPKEMMISDALFKHLKQFHSEKETPTQKEYLSEPVS